MSLLFFAFAYVVLVSRRRHQSSLDGSVAARRRDADHAATNELLPISATSNIDELIPPHLFYLKVGLVGTFRFYQSCFVK